MEGAEQENMDHVMKYVNEMVLMNETEMEYFEGF